MSKSTRNGHSQNIRKVFLRFEKQSLPNGVLLCDPITRLVAYPSFEEYLIERLPALTRAGVHLAIGDVDDLKSYVTKSNADDPTLFGHLAGNECMRKVGAVTSRWAKITLSTAPFSVCGTFGGDEVIIAVSGQPYHVFVASIRDLAESLRQKSPRPCSFASATTIPIDEPISDARAVFRKLVASVDKALFAHKGSRSTQDDLHRGVVIDIGRIEVGDSAIRGD